MPVVNPALTQFNTGEITPFLGGRTDYKKYASAAEYMENCLPLVYGPFVKRSGTRYVAPIKIQGSKTLLKPFIFSRTQAYTLEIGVNYIRFHTKGGTLLAANGWQILEIETPFTEEDLDNLDFAQSNDFLYIASGRLPLKVLKRYSHTDWRLEDVELIDGPYQDENIDKSITISASATAVGASTVLTASKDLFTADMVGLPIRLRKTAVGSSSSDAIGWATIVTYRNAREVEALVEEQFFDTEATYAWRIGEFSNDRGYPKKVTLYKGRLCLASTEAKPNTIWLSKSDSYHDFGPTNFLDNEVVDDSAISLTMAASETNQIQWMAAMRQLFIGTLGAEFRIGVANEVLTPSNASSEEVSQYGSTSVKPFKYANELIYIQQAERKIRTMYYDLSTDAYNSTNLSLFGEHLTYSGIAGLTQQIEPYSTLWVWLNNGALRSVTYQKDQEVVAWGRQTLGGSRVKVIGGCTIPFAEENRDQTWLLVERWINGQFVQYIEVLEKVFDDQVTQENGYFVDCGGTYDNPINIENIEAFEDITIFTAREHGLQTGMKIRISDIEPNSSEYSDLMGFEALNDTSHFITVLDENRFCIGLDTRAWRPYVNWQAGVYRVYVITITQGLEHLEGEWVYAIVDGAISPKRQVLNGSVTLDTPGVIVHVGLPYKCKYKSIRLDVALGQNNALASKQKVHHLYVKTYRTNYFLYGAEDASELMPSRKYTIDSMDAAPRLRSELVEIPFEANWTREPHITIESDLPLPLCILGITTQMTLNT